MVIFDVNQLTMPFRKNRYFWIIAAVSLILDQLTKYLVVQNFALSETLPLIPGIFNLTYVTNTGAAFSLFSKGGVWLRWLSLAVSLGLMGLAWFGSRLKPIEQLGYGFILGGALGNGIDRFFNDCIVNGKQLTCVVDFLEFPIVKFPVLVNFRHIQLVPFPVFNFADVFINLGIICLLIISFRQSRPPGAQSHRQ